MFVSRNYWRAVAFERVEGWSGIFENAAYDISLFICVRMMWRHEISLHGTAKGTLRESFCKRL